MTLENKNWSSLNLLWHSAYFFHNNRPSASGYIQSATTGTYSGKSHTTLLPVVDLSVSNPTAIYSVLQYICKQVAKLNIETLCITFDLPLYIKAFEISKSLQMDIVIRLGGFHLLMSFLGSIGSVMEGPGLKDGLESIYALVTVGHMLIGKAFSRALREHFLAETAIFALNLSNAIPEDFITASFQTDNQNRINEMNETENETESRMNETENNQIEESKSTSEGL